MSVTAVIVNEAVATMLCSGVTGFVPCFSGISKIGTVGDIPIWVDPILPPTSILVNRVYPEEDN
jgi:hypothetical protein